MKEVRREATCAYRCCAKNLTCISILGMCACLNMKKLFYSFILQKCIIYCITDTTLGTGTETLQHVSRCVFTGISLKVCIVSFDLCDILHSIKVFNKEEN